MSKIKINCMCRLLHRNNQRKKLLPLPLFFQDFLQNRASNALPQNLQCSPQRENKSQTCPVTGGLDVRRLASLCHACRCAIMGQLIPGVIALSCQAYCFRTQTCNLTWQCVIMTFSEAGVSFSLLLRK